MTRKLWRFNGEKGNSAFSAAVDTSSLYFRSFLGLRRKGSAEKFKLRGVEDPPAISVYSLGRAPNLLALYLVHAAKLPSARESYSIAALLRSGDSENLLAKIAEPHTEPRAPFGFDRNTSNFVRNWGESEKSRQPSLS